MRRLPGPRGGAARRDVSVAADIDVASGRETDSEAWAAHRKAERKGDGRRTEDGDERKSENEINGGWEGAPFL